MTLALAALILSSLSPSHVVTTTALAQKKIEIIKGKKGTGTAKAVKNANVELAPATVVDNSKGQDLDRKSAELDAKSKGLDQREKDLNEKQAAMDEKQAADEKKAEKLKQQQKQIEKISNGNDELWRQSVDALAGE